MRRLFLTLVALVAVAGGLGCSVNILQAFANQKTNGALYETAMLDVDSGNYSGALSAISEMTGSYASSSQVLDLEASAYGGLCGFNFLNFVQALTGIGNTLLFPFLLKSFDFAKSSYVTNCISSQNTILSVGSITQRSNDENLFLVLIAFAKIGNILSYYADPTSSGSVSGNGWDPCAVGTTRTSGGAMTDADVGEVGSGLSLAIANLTALAGTVNLGSGQLTALNNVCSALPATYDFCAVTDPTAFTAAELKGIRSLIKESTVVGLGTNCTGSVATCFCP